MSKSRVGESFFNVGTRSSFQPRNVNPLLRRVESTARQASVAKCPWMCANVYSIHFFIGRYSCRLVQCGFVSNDGMAIVARLLSRIDRRTVRASHRLIRVMVLGRDSRVSWIGGLQMRWRRGVPNRRLVHYLWILMMRRRRRELSASSSHIHSSRSVDIGLAEVEGLRRQMGRRLSRELEL